MDDQFSIVEKKIEQFLKTFDLEKYRVHEALYFMKEDEIGDIISSLYECKLPFSYHSYKDVLREKFFKNLGFGKNDLVLFVDGEVYGKLFFQVDIPSDTPEKRACSLPAELLEKYKQKFFKQNSHKEKVANLLTHAVEDILNFRKINPTEFKKIFIPVFVNIFEIVVIEHTDLADLRSIKGLSFYLLREMFDELMLFIAEDILFNFSNQDKKAIEFLSYFSVHETIDAKGERYKANPILDESNHAWNMTTIRSTMLQHKRAKQAAYDKKNSLIAINKKLEVYRLDEKELNKQILLEEKALEELQVKIRNIHKTLARLQDSDTPEVMFMENGEEKSFQRSGLIVKMFKKEDDIIAEKNRLQKYIKEIENAVENKKKEIYVWEKKYEESSEMLAKVETNGHPMDKQYERIQRALAKTLATR